MAKLTVTVCALAADRVTVNTALTVPAFPSVTVTLLIERVGSASSLLIVPTPEASRTVAFVGPLRSTPKVSSYSFAVSPLTATVTGFDVSPGLKVTTPELLV